MMQTSGVRKASSKHQKEQESVLVARSGTGVKTRTIVFEVLRTKMCGMGQVGNCERRNEREYEKVVR